MIALTALRIRVFSLLCMFVCFSSCSDDSPTNPDPLPNGSHRYEGMVRISAAGKSFAMGSASGFDDEKPVLNIHFTYDFWIDTSEVTQGEYDRLMRATYPGYIAPSWGLPYGAGADFPAYLVEWDDAVLYCNARSKEKGFDTVYTYSTIAGIPGNGCRLSDVVAHTDRNGFRLPTEAEWEYAARAASSMDFFWGKNAASYPATAVDSAECDLHMVWAGNSWELSSDNPAFGTHRVASRSPNAWGLYDMHGNVWEWCHDWYDAQYYSNSPGTDPYGPDSGDWHSLRGGSWGNDTEHLRVSNRQFVVPDYLFNFIGFRVARPAR